MENDEIIRLDKDNIKDINYDDVVAITIAEGGAMGEANAFHVVLKDLRHYYINLGIADFSKEDFFRTFPVMKTFSCFFGNVNNLENGWKWYYMGFGNYFLVREEYFELVGKYIKENFGEDLGDGRLYQKWYNVLEKAIGDK